MAAAMLCLVVNGSSRSPGPSTVLSSAAVHAPPGSHGPGRTLPVAVVSVVAYPPNSSNSSSQNPSLSTVLRSAVVHAPPGCHGPGQALSVALVSAVVEPSRSSRSMSLLTVLSSGPVAAHALSSIRSLRHTLIVLGSSTVAHATHRRLYTTTTRPTVHPPTLLAPRTGLTAP